MPEVLLGEYEVEAALGAGGMGHVVLARSRSTGQAFAVKRAHPHDLRAKERLLAELQTWIDLPNFAHFVTCHFFRTLDDEIAIFAEYVSSGSLAEALDAGRLNTLPEILDVAIQLAWGLHAAHRLGVVHQDVKPGNVLLTAEDIVKVADFGLARAGDALGASFGGALTRAYCSPEQAERRAGSSTSQRITSASDQWSWAITLLQLFTGSPPCRYGGQLAATVLESFLAQGGQEPGRPALPGLVVEVLRKCFRQRPDDRWPSLEVAADVLAIAYLQATGQVYPRPKPTWPQRATRAVEGETWDDPRAWLRRVQALTGEASTSPEPAPATTRRGRAIADLALFDQAQRRLTTLCQSGRTDLEPLLAELCLSRSLAHWAADDLPGTLLLAEQAGNLLAPHAKAGDQERAALLVEAHLRAASCARGLGRLPEAVEFASLALAICQARADLASEFVRASLSRARSLYAQEDYPAALADLERARAAGDSVEIDLLTARVLKDSGETIAATVWLDRAVPRLEELAQAEPATWAYSLASAYRTRSRLLAQRDLLPAALLDCERAETLWREQAQRDDPDVRGDLADVLALRAGLLAHLERTAEALPLFAQAQELLEVLAGPLGQTDQLPRLAHVCTQQARALRETEPERALTMSERGVRLLEALVSAERPDLASDLASALTVHAHLTARLGLDARPARRSVVVLYQELVQARGRWDLLASLLQAQRAEAWTLAEAGQTSAALERLEQALLVGDGLASSRETPALTLDLAELRLDLARMQKHAGQIAQAQATLCAVLLQLERHPEGESLRQVAVQELAAFW